MGLSHSGPKWIYPAIGIAGALAIALGAGPLISGETFHDRAAWQAKFQRPAEIPYPDGNPFSDTKAKLGRMLFFDPILSGSQTIACASCHSPQLSWQDNRPSAVGEKQMAVRSPTLLNVAWVPKLGWDGHFRDLESVAFGPILSPGNMNSSEAVLIERLSAIPGYNSAFDVAFGKGTITRHKIELALATFERSIVSGDAPFDHWMKGDEKAIGDDAKRGFGLFIGKANCVACHSGWAFSDASFHDIGTATNDDTGRGKLFPNSVSLRYAFKTPTLRDVARRPPYMHDGSIATLEAVVDLYNRGGISRPSRSKDIFPLGLSATEKADLVAFLYTLNGADEAFAMPELPR